MKSDYQKKQKMISGERKKNKRRRKKKEPSPLACRPWRSSFVIFFPEIKNVEFPSFRGCGDGVFVFLLSFFLSIYLSFFPSFFLGGGKKIILRVSCFFFLPIPFLFFLQNYSVLLDNQLLTTKTNWRSADRDSIERPLIDLPGCYLVWTSSL